MAGMMPTNDPAQQQAAPAGGMPQGGPPQPANDNQVTPEEDAQCTQFVGRAMQLMYDEKMFPHIVEMLRGGSDAGAAQGAPPPSGQAPAGPDVAPPGDQVDQPQPGDQSLPENQDQGGGQPAGPPDHGANGPAKGLAQTAVMILAKVGSAAEQAGQTLSPDVVFAAGTQIFEQLAEISNRAGISDYKPHTDEYEAIYYHAIDMAITQMAKSGELDQKGAMAAMEQLKQMDASGDLERIFQSLDAKDQGGKQPAGKPGEQPQSGGMMPQGA